MTTNVQRGRGFDRFLVAVGRVMGGGICGFIATVIGYVLLTNPLEDGPVRIGLLYAALGGGVLCSALAVVAGGHSFTGRTTTILVGTLIGTMAGLVIGLLLPGLVSFPITYRSAGPLFVTGVVGGAATGTFIGRLLARGRITLREIMIWVAGAGLLSTILAAWWTR